MSLYLEIILLYCFLSFGTSFLIAFALSRLTVKEEEQSQILNQARKTFKTVNKTTLKNKIDPHALNSIISQESFNYRLIQDGQSIVLTTETSCHNFLKDIHMMLENGFCWVCQNKQVSVSQIIYFPSGTVNIVITPVKTEIHHA